MGMGLGELAALSFRLLRTLGLRCELVLGSPRPAHAYNLRRHVHDLPSGSPRPGTCGWNRRPLHPGNGSDRPRTDLHASVSATIDMAFSDTAARRTAGYLVSRYHSVEACYREDMPAHEHLEKSSFQETPSLFIREIASRDRRKYEFFRYSRVCAF